MSERRITISPKVDRKIYFKFKDLCHAHGIAAERGIEQAMKDLGQINGRHAAFAEMAFDPVSVREGGREPGGDLGHI